MPFRPMLATLALLACAIGSSAVAQDRSLSGEETARARQLFEAGVANYENGRYIDALAEFQEAYRIKPHPLVRVNIANCYDKLDRPVEAAENFEAFLAAQPQGDSAQRDEVRSALKELQKRIGMVSFKVTPEGARVLVDDRDERRAPIGEPVRLIVGRHRVTISLEGYETALRVIDIQPQQTETLKVDLANLHPAEPPPPSAAETPILTAPPEPEPSEPNLAPPPPLAAAATPHERLGLSNSVWIGGGLTIAFAVTAIITGQLAIAANHEFDSNLAAVHNAQLTEFQRAGAWQRGVDAANRTDALAAVTDVLLGCAVVGAGITTYLFVTRDDGASSDSPRLSAAVGPTGGRLQLQAHF